MKIKIIFLIVMLIMTKVSAEEMKVAVMEFGTHPSAVPIDINVFNAGAVASEYVTNYLSESDKLIVIDKTMLDDKDINAIGLIDPDTAKIIGERLGVNYIVYGNVNDVTLSDSGANSIIGGITICIVKCHIILRMMNVETGEIICAAKGEGKSKSSKSDLLAIEVGTKKVSQESVHNAIKNSAENAVKVLLERLI